MERQGRPSGPARPDRHSPDRSIIADRLFRFYDRCATSGLPELERLATTIETR
ncbi:hypothetical protein [Nonomuraea sp. NPDC049400]|uniref:hypothetical protein n=1 Tax=Nonomuraea sp. NPDC049400 TaxID=3364352 RepID=UPI0037BA45E5